MFTFFSVTIPPSLPLLTFTVDKDLLFKPLNCFSLPSPLSHSHTHTFTPGGVKPHREHCVSLIAVGKVTLSKLSAAVCVHIHKKTERGSCLIPLWNIHFYPKRHLKKKHIPAIKETEVRARHYHSALPVSKWPPCLHKGKSCCQVWLSSTHWYSQTSFISCTRSLLVITSSQAASPVLLIIKHYLWLISRYMNWCR